jgi:plasmid stability protein
MATSLTVRGLDEALVRKLKLRAARHGRSAEAEHRLIRRQVLDDEPLDFWAAAERLRRDLAGRSHSSTAELVRQGRDER